jgi:hypothetical protein
MVAYETSSENENASVKVGKTLVCVTQRPMLCEGMHWQRHCG